MPWNWTLDKIVQVYFYSMLVHLFYLSAEGVFEVKVEDWSRGLGSDGGLEVELVSLQYVVHVLGPPVDSGPEIKQFIVDMLKSELKHRQTDLHI